ncbi:MAG TPA: dienelactone hydrolase family protein [Casimicrobiaceae bacterium]
MDDVLTEPRCSVRTSTQSDRRPSAVSSLGAGFAQAVLPVAAQVITTPADGLVAGEVKVAAQGGEIPAYRAMPASGDRLPVIVVVQEIFGVHEHIRDVCRRFAHLGYFAIAPELFARQGDASKVSDINTLLETIVRKTPDAQVMSDLDATIACAKASGRADTSRAGITGFCWGGRIVLMYAAHNPQLKAAVAWYGPTARPYHPGDKTAIEVAGHVRAATLGLYGGADQGIPVDTVEREFAAIRAAGNRNVAFHVYPDTPHAFFADYRPSYAKAAAEDGWARATAWFKAHL